MTKLNSTNTKGRKVIFSDIDGVLLYHYGTLEKLTSNPAKVLDGVKEKLQEWYLKDYKIILVTGRQESMRQFTEKQLADCGIFYHSLIMDIGRGTRILINDYKPNSTEQTAIGINLERNKGLEEVNI